MNKAYPKMTQMLELVGENFRVTIINWFKNLRDSPNEDFCNFYIYHNMSSFLVTQQMEREIKNYY